MSTYGYQTLANVGRGLQVTADGAPIAKAGGVTIDWGSVVAQATADVTFEDGDIVYVGEKFLRYGQIVCKILTASVDATKVGKYAPFGVTASGSDTITLSAVRGEMYILNESVHEDANHSDHPPAIDGGRVWKKRLLIAGTGAGGAGVNEIQALTVTAGPATSGAFTITLPASLGGATTSSLPFNATNAAITAALTAALATFNAGSGQQAVVITASGTAMGTGPVQFTFTGGAAAQDVDLLAIGVTTLDKVVAFSEGTKGIVSGPTLAAFETVFPMITYVPEN